MRKVELQDWGLIDYKRAWDEQQALHDALKQAKRAGEEQAYAGHLVLCQHPKVYTLGKSGSEAHLLLDDVGLAAQEISFYKINRGGDITHHGPGQLVGYPILDLEQWYRDVHRYVRNIEEVIIRTLADYGITGMRIPDYTGVWIDQGTHTSKICAIGVHLSRWVSMHGFAFNVNNDLNLFDNIIPCGIQDDNKAITSLAQELDRSMDLDEVQAKLKRNFETVFECELSK